MVLKFLGGLYTAYCYGLLHANSRTLKVHGFVRHNSCTLEVCEFATANCQSVETESMQILALQEWMILYVFNTK